MEKVILVLLLFFQSGISTPIHDCGSHDVDIEEFRVTNCESNKPICDLKRGENATISVKFTPRSEIKSLHTNVHGIIAGIPMPFKVPQPDGCVDSGLICPLKAGHSYVYHSTLPVKNLYPKVKVIVKWELQNADGSDAICLQINSKIV